MKTLQCAQLVLALAIIGQVGVRAQSLDALGVTLLRTVTTNLDGSGVRVAQVEASLSKTSPPYDFEVNPASSGVAQPVSLFTYISASGSSTTFPNSMGVESGHADGVAGIFYGMPGGVVTNVVHVDNYEADNFISTTIPLGSSIPAHIVNQSFTDGSYNAALDQLYDNYAAKFETLFLSGAGFDATNVWSPATCYNGIGVGVSDYPQPTYGPTPDGRSKPDIAAPGSVSSFSTPYVAGAAAVLMQAGLHGDGGSDTNSATDFRTVKALLLNGAVKPAGWTNGVWSNGARLVLDTNYGAGVLNIFNSYEQLAGGKHGYIVSTTVATGDAHPPTSATGTVGALSGWDFNTCTSGKLPSQFDAVNHYYFNVTNSVSNATFTATMTLVWNRQQNQTAINDLNLFLFNCANSNLVTCSTSLVDNVEHIFMLKLPQGRYDLQVWKAGGFGIVSAAEPYALAWEFFSQSLNAAKSGTNISISWPVYPDGFVLQTATNLVPPVAWDTNNPAPVVTNSQKVVLLNATNPAQFFRLQRP